MIYSLCFRAKFDERQSKDQSKVLVQKQKMFHTSYPNDNHELRSSAVFNIDFSSNRNIDKTTPICVSCVRFSSTAGAMNPSVLASRQQCSSCLGLTCQLCLNHCKGCSSVVCGNCSIDIESVNGYIAEMYIVCLGCRDRYDSTSCMDTG